MELSPSPAVNASGSGDGQCVRTSDERSLVKRRSPSRVEPVGNWNSSDCKGVSTSGGDQRTGDGQRVLVDSKVPEDPLRDKPELRKTQSHNTHTSIVLVVVRGIALVVVSAYVIRAFE